MSLSKFTYGFFKTNCLGLKWFLPLIESLLVCCSQKLWGLIFLALEPQAVESGMSLGLLAPKKSLPYFSPPHINVGPACSVSLPLLPVWMDVVSLTL